MPHLGVGDRVKETTTTTGTGTIDLGGAESGFQTFVDGVGNGHETYYVIVDSGTGDYEVGVGTITDAATDTLSRDTVISSSNGGSLVNFGAGSKDVFCSLPSERAVIIDDASNVEVTANITATSFDGSGAALTSLNASNVSSGTLDNARLDAQLQDIAGLATTSGKIIQGDGANFVLSSYTIPTSDGTTGQVLTTNGSGAVTFQTPTVGDITAVTAGSGLTGGGTTGDVTLNVGAGTGVTVNADDIAIGQDVATSASPTFAGGTFTANVALGDLDHILMGATGEYQIYHDHANGVSVIKDVDAGGSINIEADSISLTGPVTATANVSLGDNDRLRLGASQDLQIFHDGSHSNIIDNGSGNLRIGGDTQIYLGRFSGDTPSEAYATFNSNGAVNLYYDNAVKLATTSGGATVTGTLSATTFSGSGASLTSIPNGALDNSSITINGTGVSLGGSINVGDITGVTAGSGLTGGGTSGDVTLNVGAGTGVTVAADTVSIGQDVATSASPTFAGATFTANVSLADNDRILFGTGSDLQIWHDGLNSYIQENGTGNLVIRGSVDIEFTSSLGEKYAVFNENSSVDLYYDNVKKFETTSGGIDVTGTVTADGGAFTGDVTFTDNSDIKIGSSDDMFLVHNGSNSYIVNQTGTLFIRGDDIQIESVAGENHIIGTANGSVALYYDNSKKFETTSGGATVTGTLDVTGQEINITGTAAENIIDFASTDMRLRWLNSSPAFETILKATQNAATELYYDGSKKIETTSAGVTVTGTLTETSSIEYKENVKPLEFNEAIYNVNAVKYDRKDGSQKDEVGVIAEDLYEILPDLVQTKDGKPESVKYTKLTMYLLEALKKQNEEIQELKKRIN